jgi:hypothetical protein
MKRTFLMLALLSFPLPAAAQVAVQFTVPGVRVATAPPPARVEVRPVAPSPNHVWIGGHWAWRGGAHVWVNGHYALPPGQGYVWEPARWANQNGQYTFFEGHWRVAAPPQPTVVYEPPPPQPVVEVEAAPPEPIVEVRPAAPFAGAVWLPGYWQWHGHHHMWIGGRWSAPRAGWVWEAHRWDRGPGGRWHQVPGHWRKM